MPAPRPDLRGVLCLSEILSTPFSYLDGQLRNMSEITPTATFVRKKEKRSSMTRRGHVTEEEPSPAALPLTYLPLTARNFEPEKVNQLQGLNKYHNQRSINHHYGA